MNGWAVASPSEAKIPAIYGSLTARLNRLRKNSASFEVLKGHEFIRANKSNQFSVALATEKRSLSIFLAHETFSATCEVVPLQNRIYATSSWTAAMGGGLLSCVIAGAGLDEQFLVFRQSQLDAVKAR
jgi:hypothetical protein